MADSDSGERTEEATPRRREQARKEGQVARSQEVGIATTLLLLTGLVSWSFPGVAREAVKMFESFLDFGVISHDGFTGMSILRTREAASSVVDLVAPTAVPALLLGVASNLAQVGFHFHADALSLKWDRLDPSSWFKRMTGVELPVQLIKSLFKGLGVVLIALLALRGEEATIFRMAYLPVPALGGEMERVAYTVLVRVSAAMAVVAGLDLLWTRYRHEERLKMTREEIKREHKDAEGDPQVKAWRRRKAAENRKRSLESAVKTATVVAVNPTHYAVALRYVPGKDRAPVVVAKGIDFKALRIRELAEKHDIPVHQDIPLARALYASAKEGTEVPFELWQAVASLLKLVRGLGGNPSNG